jgi:hypothetical protein
MVVRTPREYWRNLLQESIIATNLVFGGILISYVGFALSKDGLGDARLLDFLGLLLTLYLFVKFTFAFPRDGFAGGLSPIIALALQFILILIIIAATMYSAWTVGLNGQVVGAVQASWVFFGTVDYVVANAWIKDRYGNNE